MARKTRLWVCAGVVVIVALPAAGQVVNGGFETGDLTGWTFTVHPDAIFGDSGGGPAICTCQANVAPLGSTPGSAWQPAGGTYFATLVLGAPRELVSDGFKANAAEVLSFAYFFDYGDSQPGFPDAAYALLVDSAGKTVHRFFDWNLSSGTMLPTGTEIGWTTMSYTFATTGTYRLAFGVANPTDYDMPSVLGVDNVTLMPEPVTLLALTAGAGVFGRRRRGRTRPIEDGNGLTSVGTCIRVRQADRITHRCTLIRKC